jgi:hypothetical protein
VRDSGIMSDKHLRTEHPPHKAMLVFAGVLAKRQLSCRKSLLATKCDRSMLSLHVRAFARVQRQATRCVITNTYCDS